MNCKKCQTQMIPSVALKNDTADYGMPDFPGQTDRVGQTFTLRSSGKLYDALKCPRCAWQVSWPKENEATA